MINETLSAGLCSYCNAPTHHGPWSQAQLDEACADIGMQPDDFVDTCDQCFVRDVCAGDYAHAEQLLKRKLPRRISPDNPLYPILRYLKEFQGSEPK